MSDTGATATSAPVFVQYPTQPDLYKLEASGDSAPYQWIAYLLGARDSGPDTIAPVDAFESRKGSYLIARHEPQQAALAGLRARLDTLLKPFDDGTRAIVWIANPDGPDDEWAPDFIAFHPPPAGSKTNQTQNDLSVLLPTNAFTFFITSGASLRWDDDAQAITSVGQAGYVFGGGGETLSAGAAAAAPAPGNAGLVIEPGSGGPRAKILIPLTGRRAASLTMTTLMTPRFALPALAPGVYYWAAGTGADMAFAFPLFAPPASLDDAIALATAIDPLDLLNLDVPLPVPAPDPLPAGVSWLRTGFAFGGTAPSWQSNFRTAEGKTIILTALGGSSAGQFDGPPDGAGGFVFQCLQPAPQEPPQNAVYALAPAGDYALTVEPGSAGAQGETVLTGLFGSERIGFTSWDPDAPETGSRLRFMAGCPAFAPIFPFPVADMANPQAGNVAGARLTSVYRTSWANVIGPGALYRAEPDGGAYYGGTPTSGAPLLGPAPPGTAVPQSPGFFVPIAPYAAFVPDTDWPDKSQTVSAFESQILSATRKAAFGGAGAQARDARAARHLERTAAGSSPSGRWTTTRQGLLAEAADMAGATDFLEIDLAQYRKRSADGGGFGQFAFLNPGHVVQEALQTNQLFVAAVNCLPLGLPVGDSPPAGAATFENIVEIEDWMFEVAVGSDAQLTDYTNVLILKYCDGALIDWVKNPNKWTDPADFSLISPDLSAIAYTGLSTWLATYLQEAIDKGSGAAANPLYANIAAIAQQPDWKGFLALKASLPPAAALPPQIEGLAAGIDPKRFYAHHFGATLSRVKPNPDPTSPQTLIVDGVSSLFGLIDYQDPLYVAALAAGSDPDTPLMIDAADPFGFRVLNLQALFVNARMASFQSRIQITINQLFGAPVKTTQRGGSGSWRVQPGNGIVLDGSAVNQNGTTVYVFQQSNPSLFTFDAPSLNAITVSRVQFNTLGVQNWAWPSGPAVPTITSRFLFWGAFDFPVVGAPGAPFDMLSFGSDPGAVTGNGLAFSNLQITMRSPQATPGVTDFAFDASNLAFDLGASALRAGSLFKSLGLQLQSFIFAPAGKTPLDYGFLTVAPEGPDLSELSGGWCGIVHKVNMGGPGALVAAAGFSSQLLIAWSPVAGSAPAAFVGISLPGTAPGASVFSLQGVFKITTGGISLQQPAPGQFTIKIANIGATFLGIKKIPDGTINFFLFGDPDGTGSLGWYAAYNEAKPSPALTGDVG